MGYYLNAVYWLLYTVTGPGVMLFYPLYESLKALETPSAQDGRQWLTYWILYSFLTFFECSCWKFLEWLLIWPFMKLGICLWLVLPSLNGAAYVYNNLIRKYVKIGSRVSRNNVGASSRQSSRNEVGPSFRPSPLNEVGPFPESPRRSPPSEVGASPGGGSSRQNYRSRVGALFRPRRQ